MGYVTTIAGGNSNDIGHRDGPAHNATFSSDFEITFVPQRWCLLVSDHGNELILQINLKEDDCLEISHTCLGSYSLWSLDLLLALTSLIIQEEANHHWFHHDMEASPNQIGETSSDLLLLR
ncbi:uncharacterized protein LOC103829253 [Brassica rapa]|uniref:uncharacterized protein LOC103829253 n=1 Tax=Brassica campestris TaxID=3711 RepID=UPI00142E3913|nr:uncharacterized protein LOC103829253 [Brassica rapa]